MVFPGLRTGSIAIADIDSDGDPDLTISGDNGSSAILYVYKNNNASFSFSQSLTGIDWSSLAFADYDNDGDLDLIASGRVNLSLSTKLYLNSSGVFIEASTNLPQIFESSIAWADTDNDNDLDLVISGYRGPNSEANLYLNDSPPNTPPSKPTTLSFSYTKPILSLFWNSGTDTKTPSSGLYYNIRIGTFSGSSNIVSPLHSSGQFGSYYGLQNRNFKITNLPSGRYYWAVQAIDTTLSKSAWSAEQEVIISSVNPKITFLSPLSGMVGDAVTIKAESFLSDEDIAIHFGTYQTVTTTRTNLNGTFSITFVVSTSLSGTHTITASSRIGFATTQFLIIPGPLERIQIIPQSIVLVPAQTQTFTAQGFDRWGNLLNLSYNWSLSSPIGTLSLILGLSTVFFAGTSSDSAILTASAGTISGTATISISKTSVYLSPESIVTGSGYTIDLSVNLKDVENLVGADIFLSFNPQKLEVLNIAQGAFPENASVLINQVENGTIAYSFILLGKEGSGSGQIATITLKAKEDGTSTIDFIFRADQNRNIKLLGKNGQPIPCLYNQSFITIYSYAALTGMINLDIPHINGHSGGLLILNSQETRTTTNANGRFLFSEVLPGTHTLRLNMPGASMATYTLSLLPGETKDMGTSTLLNGDSDGNGGVNISDFYFLRTGYLKDGFVIFWYNSSDLSRDGFINADFNGDNMTNIDDAYILRENFGKVADAGFRGRARKGFRQSSDSQLSIVPSIISAQPSREFVCQVVATNIKELVACELHLNFDPNLFSVKEIVEGELLKGGFPLVKGYDNQKGRISYAKGLFQGTASGSGVVAYIIFEAKASGEGEIGFVLDPSSNQETFLLDQNGEDIPVGVSDGKVIVPLVSSVRESYLYPNPRRGGDITFAVPLNILIELSIYNIAGELVYKTEESRSDGKLVWKVVNQRGERVASGVYIFRLYDKNKGEEKFGRIGIIN